MQVISALCQASGKDWRRVMEATYDAAVAVPTPGNQRLNHNDDGSRAHDERQHEVFMDCNT